MVIFRGVTVFLLDVFRFKWTAGLPEIKRNNAEVTHSKVQQKYDGVDVTILQSRSQSYR